MKSCKEPNIIINTNDLNCRTKYNLDIILMSKRRVIIRGTVYNAKKQPSIGAAIEVIQIEPKSNAREILGYSYTDNKGEYLFSMEVLPYMIYELKIYSPLVT
ncbi:hypothetical protein [Clostridium sp.]|uniref:hypothetical protein n=1 Tax=Clostridium sp. TaxID=1506 RepID=UPI002842584D|nr:hypothetical protein [Clostridium sp.]MDR3594085.1 hypothetical protein [Clostridium sp.]